MAPFESDTEVYEAIAPFLRELVGDTGALASLRGADAVVQYAFRKPDAAITFDARAGKDPQIVTGGTELVPDVVLQMDADVGRSLLSGELHPMLALTRGDIRTKGPAAKVLAVLGAKAGGGATAATDEPQGDEEPAPTQETAADGPQDAEADADAVEAEQGLAAEA
jgi:hypothetical protein